MKTLTCLMLVSALALAWIAAIAGESVYRSVDAAGNVTYSDSPPANAVEIEGVPVQEGPSPEVTRDALDRSERMAQEADARYQAIKERRRQEAEAREAARQQTQAARQRALQQAPDDAADDDADVIYVIPQWRRHHHPHPPHPPHPPPPPPDPYPQLRANSPQEVDAREGAGQRPRGDAEIIDTIPRWHGQHGPRPPPPSRPLPPPEPPPSPYPHPQLRSTP